jgi:putative ABC transport system permease protein
MSLLKMPLLQLKRKKFRAAMLILSVALALSLLIGLNAGIAGLQQTYTDLVTNSLGYTDLLVKTNSTRPTFDMGTMEPILKDNSFAAYSFRAQYWEPFASGNGQFNGSSGGYLVGINPQTDEAFGAYKMTEGNTSLTEALANPDGCVLAESFARRLSLHVGDTLTLGYYNISGPVPTQPDQTLTLAVTGIMQDYGRTYWFDAQNPTSFSKVNPDITINLNVSQTLAYLQPAEATQIYIHLQNAADSQAVSAHLQTQLGTDFTVGNLKATMYQSVQQNFGTYQTITYIIGGMALLIAAMLLLNSMLGSISERKREIGILRSVGASKTQVFGVFLAELLPIALAGALVSVPLAMVAARLITSVLPAAYIQNVGTASAVKFIFPLTTVLTGVTVGVVLTLAVGLVPALLASRIKPVEALHPQMRSFKGIKRLKLLLPAAGAALVAAGLFLVQAGFAPTTSWFPTATALVGFAATLMGAVLLATAVLAPLSHAFSQLLKPFIGRASVIVHRNVLLNFRRSVFSYGAFALSIALLVAFSSLVSTAAVYNVSVTKQSIGSDVRILVNAPSSFADQLRAVEGVQNVAGVGYLSYGQSTLAFSGHNQTSVMITGVASADFFSTIYQIHLTQTLDGMSAEQVYASVAASEGKIILQDALAQNLTLQVGDTLTWSISNESGTYQQPLQVVATADFVAGRWETISHFAEGYYTAIVNFADMETFRHPLLAGNLDEFLISLTPTANVTQTVNNINAVCQAEGYNPTVYTAQDTLAQTQVSFDQTQTLAISVTAFFVIVGALGITAATAYTVTERKREIGLLTALGMDKRQNRIIIAGEATLLALIGTVVGFASGLGLSAFAVQVIPWWANAPAPSLVVSPFMLAVAAAVIAVSAVLSAVYPAHRISKLDTVQALRQ